MNILLTGATGFIGSHIAQALCAAGHDVVCAVRNPARARAIFPTLSAVHIEYSRALTPQAWIPSLSGIDLVINAVGILQESRKQNFETLHHHAPRALFEACHLAGIKRVIQVSALGADEDAQSAYHRSKKAADDYLASLPLKAAIVQPALVYGPTAPAAKMFSSIARLPLIPLPGQGNQQIQPVYIDDLTDAIVELVEADDMPTGRIPLVGPTPLSLKSFYTRLRQSLGISSKARFLPIPMKMVELGARIGSHVPGVMLDADTLQMLNRGSTGDPAHIRRLIKREPRPVERFVAFARHN